MSLRFALAAGGCLALCAPAQACGVALFLLLDGSTSFSAADWTGTVRAHAAALRSDRVVAVVEREGAAIAAAGFAGFPHDLLAWRRLATRADLDAVATELEAHAELRRFRHHDGTGTGTAVLHAVARMGEAPACERRVVDVATDGQSNTGASPEMARAAAELAGIVVNAVALRTSLGGEDPAAWARERLVTGPSEEAPAGFVIEATDWSAWTLAIARKMALEVASR